jgi:glutamine synthetase
VTAVFAAPATVALNCAVSEVKTVALEGVTVTVMIGPAAATKLAELCEEGASPPQDATNSIRPVDAKDATTVPNPRMFIPTPETRDVQAATLVGCPERKYAVL